LRSKVWSALTRNPEKPDLPLGRERPKEKLEDYVEVPSDVVPFEQCPWTPRRESGVVNNFLSEQGAKATYEMC